MTMDWEEMETEFSFIYDIREKLKRFWGEFKDGKRYGNVIEYYDNRKNFWRKVQ